MQPYGLEIEGTTPNDGTSLFPQAWPTRWFRAKGLYNALRRSSGHWDLIHTHMLWDHSVWCSSRVAKEASKPLIITPHGSVGAPWRWKALHKKAYRLLFLDRVVNGATCIQALSVQEAVMLREFGVQCPIRVIPNGLPSEAFTRLRDPELALRTWPALRGKRVLLYLGRLSATKGLDTLVAAWEGARPANKDWVLVLTGPDYRGYRDQLERQIARQTSPESILMSGEASGVLKESLLAAADCLVLPSRGEALSVSMIEAMAASLPVLYTKECNCPGLACAGGGWEISGDSGELAASLHEILTKSVEDLRTAGSLACRFGLREYTSERVTAELLTMYRYAIQTRS